MMLAGLMTVAPVALATGGSQTFRVITSGDAYMLALSSYCADPSYDAPPGGIDTNDPLTAIDAPFIWECWVVKNNLGYDGETGAVSEATATHVNHAFSCAVTGSATGAVGNLLPYPANMAVTDSIVVGFDLNDDSLADTSYGGRIQRYSIGAVVNRVGGAAAEADVGTLAGTPAWYMANFGLPGATPSVSGNVDGALLILWNQGGSDVTIDCTF